MSDDLLARAEEWADGCGTGALKGNERERGLANILTELIVEVERLRGETRQAQADAWFIGTQDGVEEYQMRQDGAFDFSAQNPYA